MANFINYIVESSLQPVKTNVLWIKNGVPYYYNKKWKPLLASGTGGGSGGGESGGEVVCNCPITNGEGSNSIIIKNANSIASGDYSSAFGYNTKVTNFAEVALGRYNKSVASSNTSLATIFTIGNGTSTKPKNIFELRYDGSLFLEGLDKSVQKFLKEVLDSTNNNSTSIENIIKNINALEINVQDDLSKLESSLNNKIISTSELFLSELQSVEKSLDGRIKKNESSIIQTASQIELLVKEDEELSGRISEAEASIQVNTDLIEQRVTKEVFNTFTGEVESQFTTINQTVSGIETTIKNVQGEVTEVSQTVDGLTVKTGTLEADIESLKKQSDGSIDTHFGTTTPTLDNEPAVNWDTDELKNEHTGDIYYNNNSGEAFRFSYNPQTNTYFWVELTDSALTDALDKISKLEEAIDGKVTIFYTQPSNYKYGDIWFVHNSNYSPYKESSLLTATNIAKDAIIESFNLNHWVLKADIVKSLNDLDESVTNAFKDNILTSAEIDAIKENKKSFESSFQELTSGHAIIVATTLGDTSKLKTAYSNLENKYNTFIQSIDSLVLDSNGNLSATLIQEYTTAYNNYVEALKNYSKIKEELVDSIQKDLSSANEYIKDISSDGVITPIEKKNLIEIWRSIAEEFNTNKGIAVNYKIINSEGSERTDIYSDGIYYSNYALYEAAFEDVKTIFTSDVFGISNTTISTTLPTGYSINDIDSALNNYYDTLSVFSEMISKITIEITDAHEEVIRISRELQEQLSPSDSITQIGKGVILSSIIGVQSNGILQAGLNATTIEGLVDTSEDNHGRIVFAGGINGATDWNTANTVIYEDGYVHFKWGAIDEGVEIGNALIRSVVSGTIDLFSYPENGILVPLFIVNKDDNGKIISVSTPYDFIINKNLTVWGDTASGGEGDVTTQGIVGIKVNDVTYKDTDHDGIIDLGTISGGGGLTSVSWADITDRPTALSEFENDLSSADIAQILGYTPVRPTTLNNFLPKTGGQLTGALQIFDHMIYDDDGAFSIDSMDSISLYAPNDIVIWSEEGQLYFNDKPVLTEHQSLANYVTNSSLSSTLANYQLASTAINTSNISAQSVAYAANAGAVGGVGLYNGTEGIATISSAGVMEVGQYIDFHKVGSTRDYSVRLNCSNDNGVSIHLPSAQGTLALSSQIPTQLSQLTDNVGYALASSLANYLPLTGGTLSGALTVASTIQANSVICGTARLRVNTSTSAGIFAFMDARPHSSGSNRATAHIGSAYGNLWDITNIGGTVAISIYKGSVGIGREFTDAELKAASDGSVGLTVAGSQTINGNLVVTGDISA